ncbi:hypothetical protein AQ860_11275 [Burkholderia pseudomallei]|nr:hypothetical protein X990_125 [Burkholderia pseudomallei MSHR4868]OMT54644.1 hypothetical protein AQ760_17490 [Burkholderia pseudomallei]OMZ16410.1 hypothetical protein AQ859_13020 [Burkholderia pseudomallei]OMZ37298.1 hypothetical protein AQ860_11275 [Burkholderia pseudomallei]
MCKSGVKEVPQAAQIRSDFMAVLHRGIAVGPAVFGARVSRSQLTGRGLPPSQIFPLLEPLLSFF